MPRPGPATALAAALLVACACAGEPPRSKVVLVGVDGATFTILDPLLEAGRMPVLASLIERGARATLLSSDESSSSPTLWATIATGTRKAVHGIDGFARLEAGVPVVYASGDRRVPALWNLVTTRGGSAGVAGFWNTWPAEAVDGWIVSDRFPHSHFARLAGDAPSAAITWPEELAAEVAHLSLLPEDVDRAELARWLGTFTGAEWDVMLHGEEERGELRGNGIVNLKYAFQAQKSVAAVTLHMLSTRPQPDFLATFLELPDRVGHYFWHCVEPGRVPGGAASIPAGRLERWANVVPGAYELVDDAIGDLLALLDPATTVIVVSDHGMRSAGRAGSTPDDPLALGRTGVHDPRGILIAAGPAIRRGATVERATLLDVAPTVLAAMGLPSSTQFEGRVLEELLAPAYARAALRQELDEPALVPRAVPRPEGLDAEYIERLQGIGYLGHDGLDDPEFEPPGAQSSESSESPR